jgi:hypothetical protein
MGVGFIFHGSRGVAVSVAWTLLFLAGAGPVIGGLPMTYSQNFRPPPNPVRTPIYWGPNYYLGFSDPNSFTNPTFTLLTAPTNGILEYRADLCHGLWLPVPLNTPISNSTVTNVTADHSLAARFAADLAPSHTPKWWLAQANEAWTNDFTAAETNDADNDGMRTWEEYIAGTDPTNRASAMRLGIMPDVGGGIVTLPTLAPVPQYGMTNRYYTLEGTTNLCTGSWGVLGGWADVLGLGQLIAYTNPGAQINSFYRGKVRLGP